MEGKDWGLLSYAVCNAYGVEVDGLMVTRKRIANEPRADLTPLFMPPYSPELNPDELVWNYVKNHHIGKKEIKGPDDFKQKVLSCLKSLQQCTNKIVGFFHEPHVKYASC